MLHYSLKQQRKVMTRKAAAKNSRLLGEIKARVLVLNLSSLFIEYYSSYISL